MTKYFLSALALVPALMLAADPAQAGIAECGNIDVKANAMCQLETSGGCTAHCTDLQFQAQCTAELTASCDGECTADIDASCSGSCEATCNGSCTANPGSYDCSADCSGSCNADCSAECSGKASGDTASGSCMAKCQGNCSAKCSAQCTGTPPSATCDVKCKASCQGSCKAKATASCQIDCQAKGDASCTAKLKGSCTAHCSEPKGSLFCDGQFVDTGDHLQNCIDALRNLVHVEVTGSSSSSCTGNGCSAEAEGTVAVTPGSSGCSTSPSSAPVLPGVAVFGMIGLAIARTARRRRRD